LKLVALRTATTLSQLQARLSNAKYQCETVLPSEMTAGSAVSLSRELTLFDAVAVVAGTIIGSGIFLIPSMIATQLTSVGAVLSVWLAGGILTLSGALSLAELGSMYPRTGGLCAYLRNAYGPLPAFLYSWALLVMIHSGSIAALGSAFGLYAAQLVPLNTIGMKSLSALTILALTAVSCIGIRSGKLVQNVIAASKVTGLAAIILVLGAKGSRVIHLFEKPQHCSATSLPFTKFGIAVVAVLWAYEGWHVISFVGGEMKNPKVDLPRGLFYGTAIVTVIFLAANLGYYHTLSPTEIRASNAVAALAVNRVLGPIASNFLSVLILTSILGSMNGLILTGPRVYYAMARENVVPSAFGQLSQRYRTPMAALIIQGLWATVLTVSGSYEQLFTDVIFTAWIFYGLAVAAVFVLRRTQPHAERPFRVPGYPWPPILFCAAAAGLILSTLIQRPGGALTGIALVACGIPVYFVWHKLRFGGH
jgi:basic amino acid/polyamine antiporter, APA family